MQDPSPSTPGATPPVIPLESLARRRPAREYKPVPGYVLERLTAAARARRTRRLGRSLVAWLLAAVALVAVTLYLL